MLPDATKALFVGAVGPEEKRALRELEDQFEVVIGGSRGFTPRLVSALRAAPEVAARVLKVRLGPCSIGDLTHVWQLKLPQACTLQVHMDWFCAQRGPDARFNPKESETLSRCVAAVCGRVRFVALVTDMCTDHLAALPTEVLPFLVAEAVFFVVNGLSRGTAVTVGPAALRRRDLLLVLAEACAKDATDVTLDLFLFGDVVDVEVPPGDARCSVLDFTLKLPAERQPGVVHALEACVGWLHRNTPRLLRMYVVVRKRGWIESGLIDDVFRRLPTLERIWVQDPSGTCVVHNGGSL